MKFTVTWTAAATSQLTDIWLAAGDKERVVEAVQAVERRLSRDPENAGESRVVNIRILIESPLAMYFDVNAADRRVNVWRVWRFAG